MKPLNIGYQQFLNAKLLEGIYTPDAAPIKRIIEAARQEGKLFDATKGKRTRAVIVMASGSVTLSAIQPETLVNRLPLPTSFEEEE